MTMRAGQRPGVKAGRLVMLAAAAGAALLAACAPEAEDTSGAPVSVEPSEPSGADAVTPHNPLFGTWTLTGARIAPWWDGKGEPPEPDPALSTLTFAADTSGGAPIVTCAKPTYAVNIVPERGLFQGNLPDPAKDAPALGFKDTSVTVLSFTCSGDNKDVSLDFPMIDAQTIMLGLDNVIYTFRLGRS